ncbi:glycosyl transferase [Methanococcoides sp. SA1]|nr:glycosyl transferase [Methanococcoides sp. SA1]
MLDKYDWIKRLDTSGSKNRDLGVHVSRVYIQGFDYAINYCSKNSISYNYIGVLDADIILDLDYFERLMKEFESYPNLGICSGHGYYIENGTKRWSDFRDDFPTGAARLWTKESFEDTGGYIPTCSPDSVSIAKSKIAGWDTKRLKDVHCCSKRPVSGAEGLWNGYKQFAYNNYYTGYTVLHAMMKGLHLLLKKPFYPGLAYLYSYIISYILRKERTNDVEVLEYYRHIGKKRLISSIKEKF